MQKTSHKNHGKSNPREETVLPKQGSSIHFTSSMDSRMAKLENVIERLTETVELLADRTGVTKLTNSTPKEDLPWI